MRDQSMDLRKKAIEAMRGEPVMQIMIKSKAEREQDEQDHEPGMISMKVTHEEKDMILKARAEKEGESMGEESSEEDQSVPAKKPFMGMKQTSKMA